MGILFLTISFLLMAALRSDANGEFTDAKGEVVNKGFRYYTDPSFLG